MVNRMPLRRRFWLEVAMGGASLLFACLTLLSRDWIEIVFRVDPDQHTGSLEWLIVAVSLAITIVTALLASSEWRRTQHLLAESG
jgi:hypothetical protein